MDIQIRVKQLGKRKPVIENKIIDVPELQSETTLKVFLEKIVAQQVKTFNERIDNPEIINFLLPNELETLVSKGKVDFKDTYNSKKAVIKEAQEIALLAFEDGLYKVFIDDHEIEQLEETIQFTENKIFTFIRLTFLSGGYY